jgi:uncharacterized membrane protein
MQKKLLENNKMKRILKIAKVFFQLKYKELIVRPYKSVTCITMPDVFTFFRYFLKALMISVATLLFASTIVFIVFPFLGAITFMILPVGLFADISLNELYEFFILLGFICSFCYAPVSWLIVKVYKFIKSNIKEAIIIVDGKN